MTTIKMLYYKPLVIFSEGRAKLKIVLSSALSPLPLKYWHGLAFFVEKNKVREPVMHEIDMPITSLY